MKYQNLLQSQIDIFRQYIAPASLDEIESIEKEYNIFIPKSLKEFFLLVGNDYNFLWEASGQAKLSMVGYNFRLSQTLLKECQVEFSKNYFVFSSYSGDQFLFVYLDEGDDPAVYLFETELFYCGDNYKFGSSTWGYPKGVSKIADSFSELINNIIMEKVGNYNKNLK